MRNFAVLFTLLIIVAEKPVHACGFGEAPGGCGQTPAMDARDMLNRVVAAIQADKPAALQAFSRGENGFRTPDNYVFCVGSDGVMSAHPNSQLQGTDVRDLHDSTGNYFISRMLETAKPGLIANIRYLFPRPGGTNEYPKVTFYTRAGDQMCGVGVYDDMADSVVPPESPQARVARFRQRLTSQMPASLGADWTAFQKALDEADAARSTAFAKIREQIQAAETVMAVAK